ncbi:MAG: N-acetylmuramoyl-L-alanine amidase [Armatimonadota bacterium]
MPLIALDPGHGKSTKGKRSPASLGQPILREYEFNRTMAHLVAEGFLRCGITYMRTVEDDSDPALSTRARRAKEAGCKLLISLHANAGGGTGIETYYDDDSVKGQRLARLVQQSAVAETGMRDRGIFDKVWWKGRRVDSGVLDACADLGIAACLIEGGYMDYAPDLAKLREATYRRRLAVGIVKGVCLYLGVRYVPYGCDAPPPK